MRDTTVKAYLGKSEHDPGLSIYGGNERYKLALPKGNLLQMAGISLQVALAYGEPQYLCTSRSAEHLGLAERLGPALNRLATLLNLGETARMIAADSFFGYGILKCGEGRLPLAAQEALGMTHGPCVWRVGQDDFGYDVTAKTWDDCSYIYDIYTMPLNEAQEEYPEHAQELSGMTDVDRMDALHVMPRSSRTVSPELEVLFIDVYFPQAKLIATWPLRANSFKTLSDEPYRVRPYTGHWSGLYQVLTHLYSPDELVPIAQAESTKALHYLFNDLLAATAEQARLAKVNPIYTAGAEKDMQKLWRAKDRYPVPVVDPSRFGRFEIEGPTQSQTAYMQGIQGFFKTFVPTLDEPQRAPTATQGNLIRQTTNAMVAESKRKFLRVMQLVGYKLGDMLMKSEFMLPLSRPLRAGSNIQLDISWLPMSQDPRSTKIDDFDLSIEPYSLVYRSPEEKLQLLTTVTQQVLPIFQAKAMGFPINLEKVLTTYKDYAGLPELAGWFDELFPEYQAQASAGRISAPRPGVGEYTRHNVSEATDAGAMEVNFAQNGASDEGSVVRFDT